MAKIFGTEKWKKRTLTVLSATLAATLTMGVLAACTNNPDTKEEDTTKVSPTDTQLLKNGNFEYYSDNNVEELIEKRNVISSPNSWTFTSGSPSSEAASGIINTSEWDYFTKPGTYNFKTFTKGEGDDAEEVTTFETIDEAVAHFEDENVTAYDRIKFLQIFKKEIGDLSADSEAAKMFKKYNYTVDYDDVKNLNEDLPNGVSLHEGVKEDEHSVLMIHNDKNTDDVRGTAQYYTSSTTITLAAGTSAKVSVWVMTDALYHYENTPLEKRGGAYIGVTNTVGGTTLDQMQIYNINTDGDWVEYTVYVRASTFATSTFRIVLGLGQGSTDDRYFSVDGYAFFDDLSCEILPNADYAEAVFKDTENEVLKDDVKGCTVDSVKDDKQWDTDFVDEKIFALDLYAGFKSDKELLEEADPQLTTETSGRKTYDSSDIDPDLSDDRLQNYVGVASLNQISQTANKYVQNVYENDLKDKFPFGDEDTKILLLLSANGAAYTATLPEITLEKDSRMLVSFFAKTSAIQPGLTGASATVVDGETKTSIAAFDSTKLSTVDINSDDEEKAQKDIYKGWTQCFFFLENDTEAQKTFYIQLSLGPTTILGTDRFDYGDAYAAFANFETKKLTKSEFNYASTGDRAKKVSLTGGVEEKKNFDSVSVTEESTIKNGPALPANFRGVLGGSDFVQDNGEEKVPNKKPSEAGVVTGLLSSEYAVNYYQSTAEWRDVFGKDDRPDESLTEAELKEKANAWWQNEFGDARQPLVIINNEAVSYGYIASSSSSVTSSAYQRISMRVKASAGAKAYIYLMETSTERSGKGISVELPTYTYWYDDDGNICRIDPSDEDFDEKTDVLYELQDNGLYKRVGETSDVYYANLSSYNNKTDDEGNLLTSGGEIVFYKNGDNYYAYRTENKDGSYKFDTQVRELPTDICRYDNYGVVAQEAVMEIEGTGEWVNVNFYIHTGSAGKSFRVEVWNGDRAGEHPNEAGSYVIFDNYGSASASSNYSQLLNSAVQAIKDQLNEGKEFGADDYLGLNDRLPEDYVNARYYTYTFFDSAEYVRYDETTDDEERGNPWSHYAQSLYSEQLVSLYYVDDSGEVPTSYNFFFDYSATDVTIEAQYDSDTDPDVDNTTSSGTLTGDTNIWLLLASIALAVVLVIVLAIVFVRWLVKKFKKNRRVRAKN